MCVRTLPYSHPPGPRRDKGDRPKRNPAVIASSVHVRSRATGAREENKPRPAKEDGKKHSHSTESVRFSLFAQAV